MHQQIKVLLGKPEYIALCAILLFGTISAFLVPQMSVNDEKAHLLKAYSLSTGKISGRTCEFPQSITNEAASTIDESPSSSSRPIDYNTVLTTSCGSAGGYSPIMHMPQAIGIGLAKSINGSPDTLVLFGRIANVIFFAIALFFIIRFVKIGKWAYLVIGLFPLMIHTAGSLSADTVNNVFVMGTFAFIINLFFQVGGITKRHYIILVALSMLLALTKPTNLILLLPLAALPTKLFRENVKINMPFNIHKWLFIFSIIAFAAITTIVSHKLLGSMLFHEQPVENPLVQDPLRFFYIAYNTYVNPVLGYGDLLARGIVGEFSSFRYHLPTFIVFAEFIALIIALLYSHSSEKQLRTKNIGIFAFFSALAIGLLIIAITIALYSAWAILPMRLGPGAIYADGVQGRYFTAALVVLIPIAMWVRKWLSLNMSDVLTQGIIITISLMSLIFYVAQTYLVFS